METLSSQTKNNINKQAGREKLTVLLADRKQVSAVLESNIMDFGHSVIVAECYRHAIQAATKTRSDLITINMNLPYGDGIGIVSKIKEVVGSANVVSMISANDSNNDQKTAEQQTLHYIVKTLEVNEIQSILERISRKKLSNKSLPN